MNPATLFSPSSISIIIPYTLHEFLFFQACPGDEFWFGAANEEKNLQECGGDRDELVKFIFDSDDAEHAPVVSEEALADPMTEITLESILEQKAKEKIRGIMLSTLEGWRVKSGELRRRSHLFTRGRARSVLVWS